MEDEDSHPPAFQLYRPVDYILTFICPRLCVCVCVYIYVSICSLAWFDMLCSEFMFFHLIFAQLYRYASTVCKILSYETFALQFLCPIALSFHD